MREINKIVVHCSATPPYPHTKLTYGIKEMRDYHVNTNGWSDVGYHFCIRQDGLIEPGRPIDKPGAHVKGHNHDSIGVCLIGGVDEHDLPDSSAFKRAQLKPLIHLLRTLKITFPHARITSHRDLSPDRDGDGVIEPTEWLKACPSFDITNFKRRYLSDLI